LHSQMLCDAGTEKPNLCEPLAFNNQALGAPKTKIELRHTVHLYAAACLHA